MHAYIRHLYVSCHHLPLRFTLTTLTTLITLILHSLHLQSYPHQHSHPTHIPLTSHSIHSIPLTLLYSVFYFTSPNARTELDNFKDTLCKLSKDKSSKGEREGGSGGAPAPAPTLPTHAHIGEDKDSVGSAGPLYPSISDKHGNHPRGLQNPKEDPQLPGAQYTPQQQPTQPPQLSPQSYQQQQQQYQPQQPQQQPQPQSQPYQSPQQPYQPQPTQRPSQSLQYQFDEHDDYPYVSPTTNRKPSVPTSIHIPNTNNTNNTQNNNTGNPNNTKNTNKPRKPKQKEHSDEEDFFSIKEEPEDERRERDDSGGAVSFSIEVRDPQQEVELNGGKYVSYPFILFRPSPPPTIPPSIPLSIPPSLPLFSLVFKYN